MFFLCSKNLCYLLAQTLFAGMKSQSGQFVSMPPRRTALHRLVLWLIRWWWRWLCFTAAQFWETWKRKFWWDSIPHQLGYIPFQRQRRDRNGNIPTDTGETEGLSTSSLLCFKRLVWASSSTSDPEKGKPSDQQGNCSEHSITTYFCFASFFLFATGGYLHGLPTEEQFLCVKSHRTWS